MKGGGASRPRVGRGVKIFVVEDDVDLREFLVLLLLTDGHDVRAFRNGQTAADALVKAAPDVVLCDLALPGRPGEDVARAAGQVSPRPRIVLMSAEPARLENSRSLAHALLRKPFGIAQLMEAMGRMTVDTQKGGREASRANEGVGR
jgi:DNA-binding response OmpR family regulator